MELTLDQALQKGVEAHKAGKVQEADRYYTAILKANPKHPDANHNMGVLAIGVGKFEAALPFFKTALEANPTIAQYWCSHIDSLIKLNRIDDAQATLDQARSKGLEGDGFDKLEAKLSQNWPIDGDQTNEEILGKAIDLRETGKYDEAIELLLNQTKWSSTNPNILSVLSNCYILNDNLEQAKIYLDAAKDITPNIASVGWNETRLLLKQKNVNEALAIAEKTNKLFPDDVEGMNVLGSCLRLSGNLDESLKYLNKAIERDPNYAEALVNRGLVSLTQKDKIKALSDLEKAHNLKPHIKQIWDLIIGLILETKNYSKAISILIKMIEIDPTHDKIFSLLAICNQEADDLSLAIMSFEKVLEVRPNDAFNCLNLGMVLQRQGKTEKAIKHIKKAISIKPDFAEAYKNMGNALKELGKLKEAMEAYNKAVSIKPDYAQAYINIGIALREQGKLEKAIEAYNKALSIKPDYAEAHNNMGNALKELGRLNEAIKAYTKALSIKPDYDEAFHNMGNTLQEQDKLEEAIEAFTKAVAIKPDYAEAHNNMGIALKKQGKLAEAIDAYNKAFSINPDYAEVSYNMGIALKEQGKLEQAVEAYNKALSIKPNYAEAYSNIGYAYKDQGKLEEAIEAYNKAILVKPDYAEAHQNLSFVLLNNGRLKEGFDEYEWRWKTAKRLSTNRNFSQPLWNGKESLKGKTILLWSEQGVGDTINWSSCLSFVAAEAEHCILECPQKLVPLLARSFPNVEFKPENRSLDSERDDFDYHLPMGSLFRHFISKISQDYKGDAFLIPDPARIEFWQKRLNSVGNGPYIGISWKSSNISPQRMPNYASISDFSPIFKIPDVTFINMQYNNFKDDLTKIQNEVGVKVHNFDDLDQFENLEDVAALSAALDIVVSTHNVLIMIAPRVGTLTKFASWRQSPWNNILLSPKGPTIDKFDRNTWEPWDQVFRLIAKDIIDNDFEG